MLRQLKINLMLLPPDLLLCPPGPAAQDCGLPVHRLRDGSQRNLS